MMNKKLPFFLLGVFLTSFGSAQFSQQYRDSINRLSYQADNIAGLQQGIIGLVNKGELRKPDDWRVLRAWAWGVSRTIYFFETDKDVDKTRIGMEGLSRYGKAALVAMACEPRIAIGFIGSSGSGGAKLLHRVFGEQLENLASSAEYHWFAGNFIKFAERYFSD